MSLSPFRHVAAPRRIFYGDDCLEQLAPEVARAGGSRVLVFCGKTLSQSANGLPAIAAALGDAYAGAFTDVVEQSPKDVVEAAVGALRAAGADAIVALGGGSAIVTARAAAILHAEDGSVEALSTVFTPGKPPRSPRLARPKLPQFIVPTTPTTAYAKNGAAVSVPASGRRLALFDPKARAQALFLRPSLLEETPPRLFLDAALDAFAQAIQGLESSRRDPLADASLLHAVRLLRRGLPRLGTGNDLTERGEMMLAAQLVGEGTDVTGAGMTSAIGHAIGARFRTANGLAKSVVLPHAVLFNAPETSGRMGTAAECLGLAPAESGSAAARVAAGCRDLFASLGVPARLRDLDVPRDALPVIADDVVADWFFGQNPRRADRSALLDLLDAAW